jgi:hypothetical protein
MEPFVESLRDQMKNRWFPGGEELGLTWEDFQGLSTGETCVAVLHPAPAEAAVLLLVDVTNHTAEANEFLEKTSSRLIKDGAKRAELSSGSTKIAVFQVPKGEKRPARTAAFFLANDLMCIGDNVAAVQSIAAALSAGRSAQALADFPSYIRVRERLQADLGDDQPHIRWYLSPFGFAEARRVLNPQYKRPRQDMLKILRSQGFEAIVAAGGTIQVATGQHEILHRTAIFAPGALDAGERFQLAARVLSFPVDGPLDPPGWVPHTLATFNSFEWNMKEAFHASSTLVDEVAEDKIFYDTWETLRTDPNAGEIDIPNDLIGNLGKRVVMLSDNVVAEGEDVTKSERTLFAAEAVHPEGIAALLDKQMATDPDHAREHHVAGFKIWEVLPEDAVDADVAVELPGTRRFDDFEEEEEEERPRLLKTSAVTVAHGYLMVASHLDFLKRVLEEAGDATSLAQNSDFQAVQDELYRMARQASPESQGPSWSLRGFSRTDEEYRLTYELIRQGKMPESESILGKLLNAMLSEEKEGVVRKAQIDGSKLPDFEVVRGSLGLAGMYGVTEENGWFFKGFTLPK